MFREFHSWWIKKQLESVFPAIPHSRLVLIKGLMTDGGVAVAERHVRTGLPVVSANDLWSSDLSLKASLSHCCASVSSWLIQHTVDYRHVWSFSPLFFYFQTERGMKRGGEISLGLITVLGSRLQGTSSNIPHQQSISIIITGDQGWEQCKHTGGFLIKHPVL